MDFYVKICQCHHRNGLVQEVNEFLSEWLDFLHLCARFDKFGMKSIFDAAF